MTRWLTLALPCALTGCTALVTGPDLDAPDDAGPLEIGKRDAGPPVDAGVLHDAGAPPDGGETDAGGPAGSCAGALLCEDFERYPANGLPLGPWHVTAWGGAVTVDTEHPHSGTRSVHIHDNGTVDDERAFLGVSGAPIFPVPGNVVFGRMMIWLQAPPSQHDSHWTNILGTGKVPGQTYTANMMYGGQYAPGVMGAYYASDGVECVQHGTVALPVQRWACLEWRFDGPANEMDFWLDGVSAQDMTVLDQGQWCDHDTLGGQWTQPTYDELDLGWEHYHPSDPIDMWIDDVALDGQRIGCPAP